jgi:hypothetical protein
MGYPLRSRSCDRRTCSSSHEYSRWLTGTLRRVWERTAPMPLCSNPIFSLAN